MANALAVCATPSTLRDRNTGPSVYGHAALEHRLARYAPPQEHTPGAILNHHKSSSASPLSLTITAPSPQPTAEEDLRHGWR
eukprot:9394230-Alexandrium_andersonii.AAC.1